MNYTNIIIGGIILAASILYLINVVNRTKGIEKGDYMRQSNYFKIYGGIIIFMIIGLILILKEVL